MENLILCQKSAGALFQQSHEIAGLLQQLVHSLVCLFFFFVIRWQLNWVHFDISMYKMYNELSLNLTVINFQDFTGVMFRKKDYMFVLENVSLLVTYL